ncbi:MAG: TonB-dependent receptor [Candidatus Velthaea sp.]
MSTVHRAAFIAALLIAVIGAPVRAATNHATVVAQTASATGTVSGTIVDSNGRLVPGAGVTANGGGRSQKAVSNGSGTFALALPPGIYTITVSKGGYQTAQQDVVVAGGESIKANITLTVASLSNLNVIGRTSTTSTRNAATFNVSSNAAPSVGVQTIRERNTPDLSQIVQTIPGVTITDSATNVNHQFVVHGLSNETRLTIDGHPVSTGISGQFITNYAGSGLFSAVDTYQGAVVGPPSAGTSGAGIINLRTPDFSAKNGGYVLTGLDQYGGSQYTIIANANALDNRLQVVLGKSFSGYNGPSKGVIADDINTAESYNFPTNPATLQAPKLGYYPITGNYTVPTLGQGLAPAYTIASATDFSNTYSLNAQVTKVRWNFSPATSLGAEFLGLQGRYDPQGNAYGQIAGYEVIPQCVNATTLPSKITYDAPGSGAKCTVTSIYNAPWTASQIGTLQPLYQFYPGSDVRQNEPNFNLDFKTTLGADTILFRPYTANIDRFIDGSQEAAVPGNDGGWSEVTNTANCLVSYTKPSAANGGAIGPCFSANAANGSIGYVTANNTKFGTLFPYQTTVLPNGGAGCSPALPCYTTATAQAQSGATGYGTPYSTFEFDKLNGYTFTYIHPFSQNNVSVTFDHYLDDTFGLFNDTSPIPAGCTYVQPTGATNTLAGAGPSGPGYGYQPTCPLTNLPYSPISTPETASSVSSLSFTGQFQLSPKLEFDLGNYFNMTKILGQVEDQALVSRAIAAGAKSGSVAIALVPSTVFFSHYDPHFGFVYRPTRDIAIRATGGSSQTLPFANQLSGFTKVNQGASSTTLTTPNADLQPEEAVDYDLGLDYRTPHGSVFSGDIWNYTIHNPFLTTTNVVPAGSPLAASFIGENTGILLQSTTTNAQQLYSQGFQVAYRDEPRVGFGYYGNATFQRVYYLGLPASLFSSIQYPYNGQQLLSSSTTAGVPYTKAYAEFRQAWRNGSVLRMGFDYEGFNNPNNYFPYILTDLTISQNVGAGVVLSVVAQNLFNTNFGNGIARSVEYQGNSPIGAQIVGDEFTYGLKNTQNGIIGPPPQTFYFTLSKQF